MDFNDTPQKVAFREEARAWLSENVPAEEEFAGLDEIANHPVIDTIAGFPASICFHSELNSAPLHLSMTSE